MSVCTVAMVLTLRGVDMASCDHVPLLSVSTTVTGVIITERPLPKKDIANATPASVVAAAPAAIAPSLAAGNGNASAMTTAGLDAGVSSAGVAAGLAAPAATAPQIDLPPVEEEPDPGLIMVKSANPQFPVSTMRRLRKGEVEVKFEVNPDGVVDSVTVVKTTNAGLNTAAMDAVKQWRFKSTPKGHTAAVALAFNLDL